MTGLSEDGRATLQWLADACDKHTGSRWTAFAISDALAAAGPVPSPAEGASTGRDENEPQKAAGPLPDELLKTRAEYRDQLRDQLEVVARATPSLIAENLLDAWNERDEARAEVARLRDDVIRIENRRYAAQCEATAALAERDNARRDRDSTEREVARLREQLELIARACAGASRSGNHIDGVSVVKVPAITRILARDERVSGDD